MSKHTPGPWTFTRAVDQRRVLMPHDAIEIRAGMHGSFIAGTYNTNHDLDGKIDEANARLLAAAPDLLAALKRVAAEANGGRTSANDDELRDWLYCIEDVARAAIAKAEGGS